jgi:hypothetical protein
MPAIRLIIAADEPAVFFASIEDAERGLEWIDVRNGVYVEAFGPDGERFEIREDGRRVHISPLAGEPRPDVLRALLIRFLTAVGSGFSLDASLDELLQACEPFVRRG